MRESELVDSIIDASHRFGWMSCHFSPARTEQGWRTAIQGDKGFPDIFMIRRDKIVMVECKSEKGKLSVDQICWHGRLNYWEAHQGSVFGSRLDSYIWTPEHWKDNTILKILR